MLPIIAAIENSEDRDLVNTFYEKYIHLLYSEAHKHISNPEDVNDIVSTVVVRIIDKLDVFRALEPKQRVQYAIVAVRNQCYTHFRREKKLEMVSLDEAENLEASETPETVMEQQEYAQQLFKVLAELGHEDRALLEQKYILRWTDAEIAKGFGIQPESVRMKLSRARRNLHSQIEAQNFRFRI